MPADSNNKDNYAYLACVWLDEEPGFLDKMLLAVGIKTNVRTILCRTNNGRSTSLTLAFEVDVTKVLKELIPNAFSSNAALVTFAGSCGTDSPASFAKDVLVGTATSGDKLAFTGIFVSEDPDEGFTIVDNVLVLKHVGFTRSSVLAVQLGKYTEWKRVVETQKRNLLLIGLLGFSFVLLGSACVFS